jgi:hypothetical protein
MSQDQNEQNGRSRLVLAVPVLIGVILACAVFASASSLIYLATVTAWRDRTSWVLPVCLDALGILAGVVWLWHIFPAPARAYGRKVVIGVVACSVAGNALAHAIEWGWLRPNLALVMAVGSVPPIVVAVALHLGTLVLAPVPGRRARKRSVPAESTRTDTGSRTAASTEPTGSGSGSGVGSGSRTSTGAARRNGTAGRTRPPKVTVNDITVRQVQDLDAQHLAENGKGLKRDDVQKLMRCSAAVAGDLLREARKAAA